MTAHLEPFTEAQIRQLHILRIRGYQLTIVNREPEKLQLGVAGRDPSNARIVGQITSRGIFDAELVDFRPSKIMVGAPGPETTVEEVLG